MAGTSTLDPDNFPVNPRRRKTQKGHDTKSLGPSDSSDSGSDLTEAGPGVGDLDMDENSDQRGTGEHLTAGKEPRLRVNGDRDADQVVGGNEAGLGGGPDEAEEAK